MVEHTGCNSVTVTWSAPTSRVCDGMISSYNVRYRLTSSSGDYTTVNTSNTDVTLQGLLPNAEYTVEVAVITSVGGIGLYSAVARLQITGEFWGGEKFPRQSSFCVKEQFMPLSLYSMHCRTTEILRQSSFCVQVEQLHTTVCQFLCTQCIVVSFLAILHTLLENASYHR